MLCRGFRCPSVSLFVINAIKSTFLALLAESQQSLCHGVVSVVCLSVSLFLVYVIKSTFLVGYL